MDEILLVDIFDREAGFATKSEVHERAMLHRAFSVFLHDGRRMLLQRRCEGKYHSGGLLTNACCSHQRRGESLAESVLRRMAEEIGVSPAVEELFSFTYYAAFANGMTEYEIDHVFAGRFDGEITPDPREVSEVLWVDIDQLAADMAEHPQRYTVWFLAAAPRVIEYIKAEKT